MEDFKTITIKWFELGTMLFGLSCVGLSFILSKRFKRVNSSLARALSWQLFAEAVIGFVTVLFAATSWFDLYSHLDPWFVILLRCVIFGSGAATSVNLWVKVKKLEREE